MVHVVVHAGELESAVLRVLVRTELPVGRGALGLVGPRPTFVAHHPHCSAPRIGNAARHAMPYTREERRGEERRGDETVVAARGEGGEEGHVKGNTQAWVRWMGWVEPTCIARRSGGWQKQTWKVSPLVRGSNDTMRAGESPNQMSA